MGRLILLAGFFILVPSANAFSAPLAIDYAPNFWFDKDEKYYPVNPLDFYFENNQEIAGEIAKAKYDKLSFEEKLAYLTIFYHIGDEADEWVYQYWLFYVFNDYHKGTRNKHYGDWEAVFVFMDKETEEINKVIGTAHEREIFDTEIYQPVNNHIWAYVGNGSHANCVDEKDDGYCDFKKWKFFENWNKDGYRLKYNAYNLKEINNDFINQFQGKTTLTKSPELGMNPFGLLNIFKKETYFPLGGQPPLYAWEQSSYDNPEEVSPISAKYLKDKISGFFSGLVAGVTNLFKKSKPPAGITTVDITMPLSEISEPEKPVIQDELKLEPVKPAPIIEIPVEQEQEKIVEIIEEKVIEDEIIDELPAAPILQPPVAAGHRPPPPPPPPPPSPPDLLPETTLPTSTPTSTPDIIPPSIITDLSVSPGYSWGTIDLSWTAPNDQGTTTEYLIRYATSSVITASTWPLAINFDNPPLPSQASTTETLTISQLFPGQTYYWAIQSADQAGNLSDISNCPSTTPQAQADYLVISEIAARGPQGAKDEFIELYNPTDSPINLAGWSLQYASAQATTTWSSIIKDLPNFNLAGHKYYLITSATSSYSYALAMPPDLTAVALGLADQGGKIRLLNNQDEVIDLVAWGKDTLGAENEPINLGSHKWGSIERKAASFSTAENLAVLGNDYYSGNGYDIDNNNQDFVQQTAPNPQNSFHLWSSPRLVSSLVRQGASLSSVVLDDSENPIVIYYEFPFHGTGPQRFLFTRFDGSVWTYPEVLSCLTPGNCKCHKSTPPECLWAVTDSPMLIKDNFGNLHAFFSAKTSPSLVKKADIYWTYLQGDTWSQPENLSLSSTTHSLSPMALVDDQNQIHLTWQQYMPDTLQEIYYLNLSFDGSSWVKSETINLSQSQTLASFNSFLILDQSERLYLFWFERNTGIYYSQQINGTDWASSTQIFKIPGSGIAPPDRFSLAIDEQNQFHIVFSNKNDLGQIYLYYSHTEQGSWQEPVELFDDFDFIYWPKLILVEGQPYIFGSGRKLPADDPHNIYFTYFDSQTGLWQEPMNLGPSHPMDVAYAQNKKILYLFRHARFDDGRTKVYVSQLKID